MKLKKGDYIKVKGLTVEQVRSVIEKFRDAGFEHEHCPSPNGVLNSYIVFLGVDSEEDIVPLENHELFGTERRELTYDQIVDDSGWVAVDEHPVSAPRDTDNVNHPPHYTQHPSGVECIQITEHMGFNLGNAIKYIWRADLKNDAVEDLKKAVFYINREIDKRNK